MLGQRPQPPPSSQGSQPRETEVEGVQLQPSVKPNGAGTIAFAEQLKVRHITPVYAASTDRRWKLQPRRISPPLSLGPCTVLPGPDGSTEVAEDRTHRRSAAWVLVAGTEGDLNVVDGRKLTRQRGHQRGGDS